MTDEIDDLKATMQAATPKPDAAKRAADLALAQKNFNTLQGSRDGARLKSDRPKTGLWTGVRNMFATLTTRGLTTRGGLAATTALVAGAFVVMGPLRDQFITLDTPIFAPKAKLEQIDNPVDVTRPDVAGRVLENSAEAMALDEDCAAGCGSVAEPAIASEAMPAPSSDTTLGRAMRTQSFAADSAVRGRIAAAPDVLFPQPEANTEEFANADTNPLKVTAEDPVSTFSIDVDTASYSVVRNSLLQGQMPPKDAVRVEEMVNYFPYDYAAPTGDAAFQPSVSVIPTPWNADTQLVHIGIQGAEVTERPPLNLVFLIDTSGSMNAPDKLPLLKQSFALMLGQLRPVDQVSIVTYAGSAGRVLEPTAATERTKIMTALDNLNAGGSTAGQAGLQQAYTTAAEMAEAGEVSRVILATDGDFNVGLSDPEALKDYIADKRESGTYLSVLGFGRGNLDDATMQALAQNGNGQAAYIDTLSEAQKVLVDQLSGALFPIADDVKIQVEFNPATIAEYRLIGYETRALRREDFNNDKVDAGDIGAGHRVTAIYEVTPVGSPAQLTEPLRYGGTDGGDGSTELGFLRLRHKAPGATDSALIELPITPGLDAGTETGFAVAIAGFGQLLRGGTALGDWGYGEAIALAVEHQGADPFGYRREAVQLMRLAQSLSAQ